ncbi:MAG: DUF177 domain-containing protein [candidate division Zixibacteria bacterium]|nr:DUF177 domain-containing protein [candidate division Zixibacteria bacterium]MDH4033569.1 DUF177 domain-containing protein [candidate division Zixibacteria bacterium]
MIIDFREFETFPAHKVLEGGPEKISLDYQGVHSVQAVKVDLSIQKSGEEYFCRGEARARTTIECARCLALYEMDVNNQLDFIVCSADLHQANAQEAVDAEDYVHFVDQAMRADISEVVRQAILLAVDLKPLCSDDCAGLCAQCGKNLNDGVCDCKNEVIDERWAALKDVTPPEQQPDNS